MMSLRFVLSEDLQCNHSNPKTNTRMLAGGNITMDKQQWVIEVWQKLCAKMEKNAVKYRDSLPYISIDGEYTDEKSKRIC